MRIALVHDWVTGYRGGERVLDALARAHPDATLHTLIHRRGTTTDAIDALTRRTSPLDRIPGIARHYRKALPVLPWAAQRLRPEDCDLVVSISHAVAKAVRAPDGVPHLCYCLTPMRYVWDQADAYLGRGARRLAAAPLVAALRRFDQATSAPARVDRFVAISEAVATRIARCYGRRADVVHPPVDVDRFRPSGRPPGDYFLMVGGFVPYKREALAIEAFRRHGGRLVIVGDGPVRRRLARRAPPNVSFTGRIDDSALAELYAGCRALVHPQEEDFGIAAVEVQAAGRPVVAFGRGGALDTVRPVRHGAAVDDARADDGAPASGVFFDEQTVPGLRAALAQFERNEAAFDAKAIRARAERFSTERFLRDFAAQVAAVMANQ